MINEWSSSCFEDHLTQSLINPSGFSIEVTENANNKERDKVKEKETLGMCCPLSRQRVR